MGFRFRRSIGLGRFLRLNVGKQSASVSVGVPGLRMNLGPRGPRVSAGIPGTGMSWNTAIGASGSPVGSTAPAVALARRGRIGCWTVVAAFWLLGLIASLSKGDTAIVVLALVAAAFVGVFLWEGRKRRLAAERFHAEQETARQQRWAYLAGRFGPDAAQKIWTGQLWVGETAEMLIESLGPPLERDEKLSRSRVLHTYKYRPLPGHNRWGLRIELENGCVVGWEAKEL